MSNKVNNVRVERTEEYPRRWRWFRRETSDPRAQKTLISPGKQVRRLETREVTGVWSVKGFPGTGRVSPHPLRHTRKDWMKRARKWFFKDGFRSFFTADLPFDIPMNVVIFMEKTDAISCPLSNLASRVPRKWWSAILVKKQTEFKQWFRWKKKSPKKTHTSIVYSHVCITDHITKNLGLQSLKLAKKKIISYKIKWSLHSALKK